MLLIPAIDLRQGRCVRLLQGDFNAQTAYPSEPLELLERYKAFGARWLHIVDLDGAKDGIGANRAIIQALARDSHVRLQVGGGVRSEDDISSLIEHGVARIVIGSVAIEHPQRVLRWLKRFGWQRLCLAFDVRFDEHGTPRPRTRGWTVQSTQNLWEALEPFAAAGVQHVLCTDIACDGALSGPNLALYREALTRWPKLAWQASGGVRDRADLTALEQVGLTSAITGRALLEERINLMELKPFLPSASSPA